MITQEQHDRIRSKIDSIMSSMLPGLDPVAYKFRTDMKRVAGLASRRLLLITLNEQLFEANEEEFMDFIIPHECAHLIVNRKFPEAKQAHGPEFRHIMRVLGARPDTYHKMDVSVAYSKPRPKYTCACGGKVFTLSMTLHNRAQKGITRFCNVCKATLQFKEFA